MSLLLFIAHAIHRCSITIYDVCNKSFYTVLAVVHTQINSNTDYINKVYVYSFSKKLIVSSISIVLKS